MLGHSRLGAAQGFQNQTVIPADYNGDGRIDVITGDITPNGERLMLYLAPDWKPIRWTEEERKKGQAWGLKTIESFHTHGTPPVEGH